MEPTLTSAEAGFLGGMFMSALMFAFIFWILTVIASWKIFEKAGEPGWKAIIPIYNLYIMYKIVGMGGWFWGMLGLSILLCVIMAVDGTSNLATMSDAELAAFNWGEHIPTVIGLAVTFVLGIVIEIFYAWRTSRAFGHGIGYTIGLIFLPNIFWLILGFGKSKYNKKLALK